MGARTWKLGYLFGWFKWVVKERVAEAGPGVMEASGRDLRMHAQGTARAA